MKATKVKQSPAEIIAGALEIFDGGKNWIPGTLHETDHEGNERYCAIGALSKAADGRCHYMYESDNDDLTEAANIVTSCVPRKLYQEPYPNPDEAIPDWNDSLSPKTGFRSIKRVFCKALKIALEQEKETLKIRRKQSRRKSQKAA